VVKATDAEEEEFMKNVEELPATVQKELAVKSETVTPMWWAIWVLFKVGPFFCLPPLAVTPMCSWAIWLLFSVGQPVCLPPLAVTPI
jgi:hypothetical protein